MARLGRSFPSRYRFFKAVQGSYSSSDVGVGSESASVVVTTTETDSGSGLDTALVTVSISGSDTGSEAEQTPNIVLTASDVGSGVNSQDALGITPVVSETGTGREFDADILNYWEQTPNIGVSGSDTNIAVEDATISVAQSDASSGAEGTANISHTDSDSGLTTENAIVSASVLGTESGSGSETHSTTATSSGQDVVSGLEDTPSITVSSSEAATDVEDATVIQGDSVSDSDAGSAAEGTPDVAQTLIETLTAVESTIVNAASSASEDAVQVEGVPNIAFGGSDSGTLSDGVTTSEAVVDSDVATTTSEAAVIATSNSDQGTAAEASPVISLAANDVGIGANVGVVNASVASSDVASGLEGAAIVSVVDTDQALTSEGTTTVTVAVAVTETVHHSEGASIIALLDQADVATVVETVGVAFATSSNDSGTATEDQQLGVAASDTFSTNEVASIEATLATNDFATAGETAPLISFSRSDTGSGQDTAVEIILVTLADALSTNENAVTTSTRLLADFVASVDGNPDIGFAPDPDTFVALELGSLTYFRQIILNITISTIVQTLEILSRSITTDVLGYSLIVESEEVAVVSSNVENPVVIDNSEVLGLKVGAP